MPDLEPHITDGATIDQTTWRTALGGLILAWLLARHPHHADAELEQLVTLIREGMAARRLDEPLIPHFEGAYQMALHARDTPP